MINRSTTSDKSWDRIVLKLNTVCHGVLMLIPYLFESIVILTISYCLLYEEKMQ